MKGSKKGKKTFTEGLGELFHHALHEDNLRDKPSMLIFNEPAEELIEKLIVAEEAASSPDAAKQSRKKNKSFTNQLEDFFNDSVESEAKTQPITTVKRNIQRNAPRPAVGIDVLLNRTLIEEDELPEKIKRLTLVLDDDKLARLKEIARKHNKKINDLVLELIEMYIGQLPSQSTKGQAKKNKSS